MKVVIFFSVPLFFSIVFLNSAFAEGFGVTPVKLFFGSDAISGLLRVENDDTEKVDFQVEVMRWYQAADGKDQYETTKDIVFFPKIGTVEKGVERILRVGYRGKGADEEETYRIFIRQISVPVPGETGIRFNMVLSLPVFIQPKKQLRQVSIESVQLEAGKVFFQIKNGGNSHFMVPKIEALGFDASRKQIFKQQIGGWYVLAGSTLAYTVNIPEDDCNKAKEIKVHVSLDWEAGNKPFGNRQFTIHPDIDKCQHAIEQQKK